MHEGRIQSKRHPVWQLTAVFSWCLTVAFKFRKNSHVTLVHYFSSYLTFDIIFIRNLWMFFQGWRGNILKFFDKGRVFNNHYRFCIWVSRCLKIADRYKCGVGWEQSEIPHHTANHYEKREECGSKRTAERTLQKHVLGKESFSAQRRQQNSVPLGDGKAAGLSGPWLLEAGSHS